MVNWNLFEPTDFEYDFESDKLANHSVAFEEAVECFFSEDEEENAKTSNPRGN